MITDVINTDIGDTGGVGADPVAPALLLLG